MTTTQDLNNVTIPEQVVTEHLVLCNERLCIGHRKEKDFLFPFKVGEIVTTNVGNRKDLIAIVYGYIYSPFTESYRAVLGVNYDCEIDYLRLATNKEIIVFNVLTDDLKPVLKIMSTLF